VVNRRRQKGPTDTRLPIHLVVDALFTTFEKSRFTKGFEGFAAAVGRACLLLLRIAD
jgi:hypothetical protein